MQDQSTKPTRGKYLPRKNKKTKRLVTIAVIVVVLAAVLILPGLLGGSKEVPLLDLADTTALTYTDLRSTISATGTVESASSTTVYSTVAYPVMAVHVEVGDYVKAGDLLAELDDHTIRNQITSQQITLDLSTQSSQQQVQSAQETYNNFKSGLDQGLNATLNAARTQAENAYRNYEKAQLTYDRYVESLSEGENTAMINAEAAYRAAVDAHDTALDTYRQLRDAYNEADAALYDVTAQLDEAVSLLEETKSRHWNRDRVLCDGIGRAGRPQRAHTGADGTHGRVGSLVDRPAGRAGQSARRTGGTGAGGLSAAVGL